MSSPICKGEPCDILVVDDEEVIRVGCTQVLTKAGYQVRTAPDAESALEMFQAKPPDLVILDLKMPGIGGMEFLARASKISPETVIVVITGYATLESAVEAMKQGAYDFLPKPFTPDELKLVVSRGIERRQLLLKTAALEREKQMLRDSFAAVVSHQLRSPLVGAMQFMELIDFRFAEILPSEVKSILAKISGRLQQLLEVIDKWQHFFKTGTTLKPEDITGVDLPQLLRNAWEAVSTKTPCQIKFQLCTNGAQGRVRGNPAMLSEMFANLFSNAIKYSTENPEVIVSVKQEKPWAIVDVTDHGIGIPEEDLPRIFECFYRGTGEAAKKSAGLGLGLALVKRIVEAHGGSVSVKSKVGCGTTFTVKIPLCEDVGEKAT